MELTLGLLKDEDKVETQKGSDKLLRVVHQHNPFCTPSTANEGARHDFKSPHNFQSLVVRFESGNSKGNYSSLRK